MAANYSDFDITKVDSGQIDLNAPDWMATRLLSCVSDDGSQDLGPVEERRLRLLSDAVIAVNLCKDLAVPAWASQLDNIVCSPDRVGAIQPMSTPAEVSFMSIDRWLVVLLPRVTSQIHADMVVSSLNDLYEEWGYMSHWVLDMAAVTELPSSLVGYLIGFNQGLRSRGRSLALLWMQHSVIPPALLAPMIKHFSLIKKGMFYLSNARVGS